MIFRLQLAMTAGVECQFHLEIWPQTGCPHSGGSPYIHASTEITKCTQWLKKRGVGRRCSSGGGIWQDLKQNEAG